ncbi:MAG: hypothetical protein RL375_4745 [Pseudomonadota bacterium]
MNALLKSSLSALATACLVSCGGGGSGGGHFDESAALRSVADAAQAASASSTAPVDAASDPSLALIEQAARAGQMTDSGTWPTRPTRTGGASPSPSMASDSPAPTTVAPPAATPTSTGGGVESTGLAAATSAAASAAAPATPPAGSVAAAASTSMTRPAPGARPVPAPVPMVAARSSAPVAPGRGSAPSSTSPAPSAGDLQASQPEPPLADCGLGDTAEQILRRINEIRARGASCGAKGRFAPAAALSWNPTLYAAAAGHAVDMAVNNYFAHQNPAGQAVRDRVVDLGYAYQLVAENIAAGQPGLEQVLAAWLASEGHCANLMQPAVRDVALACASEQGAHYATYWTLNVASSR